MPRYDVFLEGRTENSTCYFGVAVMADDQKEAEFLGHEAGRRKHRECDEIEVVSVRLRQAGKRRLCQCIPLKERALNLVKEAITNGRKRLIDANELEEKAIYITGPKGSACHAVPLGLIQAAPTIDPETLRPTAKWIVVRLMADGAECKCGNCGRHETFTSFDRHTDHVYCCRCGYKMEGLTNE